MLIMLFLVYKVDGISNLKIDIISLKFVLHFECIQNLEPLKFVKLGNKSVIHDN